MVFIVFMVFMGFFIFRLYVWKGSTMKNTQYSIPFSPQKLYLTVCLSPS